MVYKHNLTPDCAACHNRDCARTITWNFCRSVCVFNSSRTSFAYHCTNIGMSVKLGIQLCARFRPVLTGSSFHDSDSTFCVIRHKHAIVQFHQVAASKKHYRIGQPQNTKRSQLFKFRSVWWMISDQMPLAASTRGHSLDRTPSFCPSGLRCPENR
jgi:hypothetical protein